MKQLSVTQKRNLVKKSNKALRLLSRKKKWRINQQHSTNEKTNQHEMDLLTYNYKTHRISAPKELDLIEYPQETTEYFFKVHEAISKCPPRDGIFFDLSITEKIAANAVMYIIALIYNTKRIKASKISSGGNEPKTAEAKEVLNKVGFFDYVKSRAFHPRDNGENQIKILQGKTSNNELAAKICDFVHEKTHNLIDRLGTKRLYAMLIELMNNAFQHAYDSTQDKNYIMYCNWYVYVENMEDKICFVFLDTGLGIPKTIRRSYAEKFAEVMGWQKEAMFISSALRGMFRTETGEKHRGKGLPEIYQNVCQKAISSLSIMSGRGLCHVNEDGSIIEKSLNYEFKGTLFTWYLNKGGKLHENNYC